MNKATRLVKKDWLYILLLTLLIAIFRFPLGFEYNELDVLPYSYAVFNPDWLAYDWYLSGKIEYRFLFSYLLGGLIEVLGFVKAAFVGRIISYLFFAAGFMAMIRAMKWRPVISILGLMVFLLFRQSLGFGEWMIGGVETKVFAYASLLFALSFLLRNDARRSLFFSGLGLSFHLLIGLYHLAFVLLVLLLLNGTRFDWIRRWIKESWAFVIAGLPGIYGVIKYLIPNSENTATDAWRYYVELRVPHHVLPPQEWVFYIKFIVLILAVAAVFRFADRTYRMLALYALASFLPFIAGLIIYSTGGISAMRFYWFRMSDSLFFLLAISIIFNYLGSFVPRIKIVLTRSSSIALLLVGISLAIVFRSFLGLDQFIDGLRTFRWDAALHSKNPDPELTDWIRDNTPKRSVFIVPVQWESFYVNAERSVYVSFKHAPQKELDVEVWHDRLVALNAGNEITKAGFDACGQINKNFQSMEEADLKAFHSNEGVDYIVLPNRVKRDLPTVYVSKGYTLYSVAQNP